MQSNKNKIIYINAQLEDASAIAVLHTKSWRKNYAEALSNDYLQQEIEQDRLQVWHKKLSQPNPNFQVLLAKSDSLICGFVSTYFKSPEEYPGALLDNIHVLSSYSSQGIGKQLFTQAAQWIYHQSPNTPLYLWVLAGNLRGQAFYRRLGGQSEIQLDLEMPGSGKTRAIRYIWKDLSPFS